MISSATSAKGLTVEGVMLLTRTMTGPNWVVQHAADPALRQGEHRVGLRLVDHRVLRRLAEVGVLGLQVRAP